MVALLQMVALTAGVAQWRCVAPDGVAPDGVDRRRCPVALLQMALLAGVAQWRCSRWRCSQALLQMALLQMALLANGAVDPRYRPHTLRFLNTTGH